MSYSSRIRFGTFALGATLLFASSLARAGIPGADGIISACYKKTPSLGVLRVIDVEKGQSCWSIEKPLSWQQETPTPAISSLTMEADDEAFSGLPTFASRATVTVTAPVAGSLLVNAWTTITTAGLEGFAFSRLRNTGTDEVSTIQATSYKTFPSPIAVGWVFEVPAGEHVFSLDVALSANITQFSNKTMTALFVPAANED